MTDGRPFELDRFQVEAMAAVDAGCSVLVSAPTSSGKTVVAEHAIDSALAAGLRAFYTAPIKALSNQKFRDLGKRLGHETVGLMTGDQVIDPEAPVVVMTTEVLRNMLYADSPATKGLGWVVLDEVHFLEDPYRGAVWEEVVLNLPASVGVVALSATVSNAEELGDWLTAVRGPTTVVREDRRPVRLKSHYLVAERSRPRRVHLLSIRRGKRPNPDGQRFDVNGQTHHRRGRGRRNWASPRRDEVLGELSRRDMLPAIHFIFSRAGCDEARDVMIRDGVKLNNASEALAVDALVDDRLSNLPEADLAALGVAAWREGLRRGVAAHHAGLVPAFKEVTEELFATGLLKIVYATETLALGVNLPARAVVIDRLTKFNGQTHQVLTPGQFTQLTGRAGRRGLDDEGHALVCWSPFVSFNRVAGLASSRDFVLRSAFRPTYNMVANLVLGRTRVEAADLLSRSFAQFQLDRQGVAIHQAAGKRRPPPRKRSPRSATTSLSERMEAALRVLETRGMADGWYLKDRGLPLASIHNEADLLIAESLDSGLLEGLDPAMLSAVVSCLSYRKRGPGEPSSVQLAGVFPGRFNGLCALAAGVASAEREEGLEPSEPPDPGFAHVIYAWANGEELAKVLNGTLTGGEFVRNVRLVTDLMRQLTKVAPPLLAATAEEASRCLDRGVVALAIGRPDSVGEMNGP